MFSGEICKNLLGSGRKLVASRNSKTALSRRIQTDRIRFAASARGLFYHGRIDVNRDDGDLSGDLEIGGPQVKILLELILNV